MMRFKEVCMPDFNFLRDIDGAKFKWAMEQVNEPFDTTNLAESFEKTILAIVIERIKKKQSLDFFIFWKYGFNSEKSFFLFLKDPLILEKIKIGFGSPEDLSSVLPENLSPELLAKVSLSRNDLYNK